MTDIATHDEITDTPLDAAPIRVSSETVEFRVSAQAEGEAAATVRHLIEYRTMAETQTVHGKTRTIAQEVHVYVDGAFAGDIQQEECESQRYSTSPIADTLGYPVRWLANFRSDSVRDAIRSRIIARCGELDHRGRKRSVSPSVSYTEHTSRRAAVAQLLGYDDQRVKAISKRQLSDEATAAV